MLAKLASYTLVGIDASADAQDGALSDAAKRGMALFYSSRLGCSGCHSGFNFAGAWRDAEGPTGEPSFARNGTGPEAMRVPTLRNLDLTGPYMHDGRFTTLAQVVEHYVSGIQDGPALDQRLRGPGGQPQRLQLSIDDKAALVAFLGTLTDNTVSSDKKFSDPFKR
jgi:cytochrome c peroxidase